METARPASSLRVIGGKWRSRKITFPAVPGLRPTGNRIRETLFNWLQDTIPGANCLDLFAGSGACGIEALSRGARNTLFLESNRQAVAALSANLSNLDARDNQVLCVDALAWLATASTTYKRTIDVAFIDPPFSQNLAYESCSRLEESQLLKNGGSIYVESDKPLDFDLLPHTWLNLKHKQAGVVHYYLFTLAVPTSR